MIPAEVRNLPALPGPPDDAAPAEHVRALLDTQLRLLVAHDEGTRAGADPEDLHRMRVDPERPTTMLPEEAEFYRRHFPGVPLTAIAQAKENGARRG